MRRNKQEQDAKAFLDSEMNRILALGSQPTKIRNAVFAVERAHDALALLAAKGVEVAPRVLSARRGETEVRATEESGGFWHFEIWASGKLQTEFRGRRA